MSLPLKHSYLSGYWGQHPPRMLYVFCILSAAFNLASFWLYMARGVHLSTSLQFDTPAGTSTLYLYCELDLLLREWRISSVSAPAEDAVHPKIVKFTRGLADDIPIYERRPTAEVDAAWRELYSVETKIPKSEALKMTNQTWPLHREPGYHIIALDVFHQLHCLDMLRQRIHTPTIGGHPSAISDANTTYPHVPISHLRHCIGAIRQALMCAADITPIVWQWSEPRQLVEQQDDVVHMCRDFGSVRRWAEDADRRFVSRMEDFRAPPGNDGIIGAGETGEEGMDWGGHHDQ